MAQRSTHASLPLGQAAILSALEDLPVPASLLMVAAYQAGFSEEIRLVAQPILTEAITTKSEVSLVSSEPSGALLARRLLAELPQAGQFSDQRTGVHCLTCFWRLRHGRLSRGGVRPGCRPWQRCRQTWTGFLFWRNSYEGAQFWVEQFSARQPDLPLYLLVTAQAGPMLAPYWTSGQVRGMISGISGIEIAESQSTRDGLQLHLRSAYQVGEPFCWQW